MREKERDREDLLVRLGRGSVLGFFATVALPAFRIAPAATFSDLFLAIASLLAIRELVRRRNMRIPPLALLGIGLFYFGAVLSAFQADDPLAGVAVTARLFIVAILAPLVVSQFLRTSNDIRLATQIWLLSAAVCALVGLGQLWAGGEFLGFDWRFGRAMGVTGHPNDLGLVAAGAAVAALGLRWHRLVVIRPLLVAILVGAMLGSGSMAGLGGALVGGVAYLVWSRGSRVLSVASALVLFAVFVAAYQADVGTLHRGSEVFGEGGTLFSRLATFEVAMGVIDRNPLVGIGFVPGNAVTETGHTVHNAILGAWYQGGVFAAIGLVLTLAYPLLMRRSQPVTIGFDLGPMLRAAFIVSLAVAMTGSQFYSRFAWAPAILWVAYCLIQDARRAAVESTVVLQAETPAVQAL